MMKSALRKRRSSDFARHGAELFLWMLLRAAMQALIILLLARYLGAQPYGQFVAVVAISSFFTPFVGLGLSHMVLRNSAMDPLHEGVYLGRALRWWMRSLPLCVVASVIVALKLLPGYGHLVTLCAVIIAELSATSLTELSARNWQARQKIKIYGAIHAGLPGIRLLALTLLLTASHDADVNDVLWAYTVSSLLYAGGLFLFLPYRFQQADLPAPEPMTARSGLPFSLAGFAMKLQTEFNKPVLAQAGFGLAGAYNVAQRAVDLVSLPLLALQEVLWPRLYAQSRPLRQLSRIGGGLLVLAFLLGVVIWFAAPLLLPVFGDSFADAVVALRMLAWLPMLQLLRGLLNFHAIHDGRMQQIGWVYGIGGVASIIGVFMLVPVYGLVGAVLATYAAEAVMIAFLVGGVIRSAR